MTRNFDFTLQTKDKTFFRQWNLCAHCGRSLISLEDHAHHVIPDQSGKDMIHSAESFLRTVDNCVILCSTCHYRVHENGKYRNGAVAPGEYFPYSHGQEKAMHQIWCSKINKQWKKGK
jgi:HNH endonuclease